MGVDTEIIINAKWSSRDICDFLNAHFEMDDPAKERDTHTPSYTTIGFKIKGSEPRTMSYHREYPTPLGNAVLCTLSCHGRAQEIMKLIGEKLGGFYQAADTKEEYELCQGMLYPHDGLMFFLENAVLKGELTDDHDINGLQSYIKQWNAEHKR